MSTSNPHKFLEQYADIARWLYTKGIEPNTCLKIELPSEWKKLSTDHFIDIAKTADGRFCILIKNEIEWKDNFKGIFYCDQPLHPSELIKLSNAVSYITLHGLGIFEELYIHKQHTKTFFEIFFDLN